MHFKDTRFLHNVQLIAFDDYTNWMQRKCDIMGFPTIIIRSVKQVWMSLVVINN